MSIGEKIKQAREKKGWTQAKLGKELGVTQQMIGIYEKNQRKPKAETIQKIADALEISVSDLVEEEKDAASILTISRAGANAFFDMEKIVKMIDELVDKHFDDIGRKNLAAMVLKDAGMSTQSLTLNSGELIESIGLYATAAAKDILTPYSQLNETGKQRAIEYVTDLAQMKKYQKKEEKY